MKSKTPATIVLSIAITSWVILFSGCASSGMRAPDVKTPAYRPSVATPVSRVSVEVTAEVREKLKTSFIFDQDELRRVVKQALAANGFLNHQATAAPSVNIKVTNLRVRSTFNAVMWGAMSGNDSIRGEVTLVDAEGRVLDKVIVSASYALGGFGGGQDATRLNWLYEAFAKELIKVYQKPG